MVWFSIYSFVCSIVFLYGRLFPDLSITSLLWTICPCYLSSKLYSTLLYCFKFWHYKKISKKPKKSWKIICTAEKKHQHITEKKQTYKSIPYFERIRFMVFWLLEIHKQLMQNRTKKKRNCGHENKKINRNLNLWLR